MCVRVYSDWNKGRCVVETVCIKTWCVIGMSGYKCKKWFCVAIVLCECVCVRAESQSVALQRAGGGSVGGSLVAVNGGQCDS